MKDGTARKILLVDDHPAVRQGLAILLEEAGVGACCETETYAEALEVAESEFPDVALVDLSIENSMSLVAELRARHIPVLVCSMDEQPDHVRAAMAAGARGYITKGEAQEVVRAARGVLEGWMLISPRAAEGLEAN